MPLGRRRPRRSSRCQPRSARWRRGRGRRRPSAAPLPTTASARPGRRASAFDEVHLLADPPDARQHPADADVGVACPSRGAGSPRSPRPPGSPGAPSRPGRPGARPRRPGRRSSGQDARHLAVGAAALDDRVLGQAGGDERGLEAAREGEHGDEDARPCPRSRARPPPTRSSASWRCGGCRRRGWPSSDPPERVHDAQAHGARRRAASRRAGRCRGRLRRPVNDGRARAGT